MVFENGGFWGVISHEGGALWMGLVKKRFIKKLPSLSPNEDTRK